METWIIITIVITIIIIIGVVLYFVFRKKDGKDGTAPTGNCKDSGMVWDESCLYMQEKVFDSTLTSPKGKSVFLIDFIYNAGAGPTLSAKCWYRFRYVNTATGGYSDFSDWTPSAVSAGSCTLPCENGKCSIPQGLKTCQANQPTIGIRQTSADYDPLKPRLDGSFIYMNLHRYVGDEPPGDDTQDEIVGVLLLMDSKNNFWQWVDVANNPCSTTRCLVTDACQNKIDCKL